MSDVLRFIVPGEPQGKGRARSFARLTKAGKIIQGNYTPDKTVNYEAFIKERFLAAHPGHVPLEGPLFMSILSYFSIPASTSNRKREAMLAGTLRPTKKPDNKNILAAIEDALNTVAYRDDKNIVSHRINKYYGGVPGVVVEIYPITEF